MWNNGHSGEFTNPMGEEILIGPGTIARMKVHEITEDSPLRYSFVKLQSEFDKLEEGKFGAPSITSPQVAHTSESAPAFSQPQYERPLYYYFDQHGMLIAKSQSKLVSSAPGTDKTNLGGTSTIPLGMRLYYCYFKKIASLFLGRNLYWSLRCLKPIRPIQEGLALFFLLLHTHPIWFVPLEPMTGQ